MVDKRTKNILAAGLLVLFVLSLTAPAVSAAKDAQDLKITDKNLEALNQGTWAVYDGTKYPSKLLVYESANLDVPYQKQKMVGEISATKIADYKGLRWGQSVSFVKALSKSTTKTASWVKGRNVVSAGDVSQGTVIATFNKKGKYYGHAAIFREYVYDSNWNIIGFSVWDQNYVKSKTVGRHDITSGTRKTSKATDYYVVQVGTSTKTYPVPITVKFKKPSVISDPANSKYFKESSRKSGDIRWIVIHDVEGSYDNSISDFKHPKVKKSAHYVISKDGEITQMVSDKDIAYHAGNYAYNKYSIGIEHEGYADKYEYTREQYIASANLVKWLCQEYDIPSVHYSGSVAPADPKAGMGIIGHYQVPNETVPTKGGGNSGHYDPGKCWDWTYYMETVNADYSS